MTLARSWSVVRGAVVFGVLCVVCIHEGVVWCVVWCVVVWCGMVWCVYVVCGVRVLRWLCVCDVCGGCVVVVCCVVLCVVVRVVVWCCVWLCGVVCGCACGCVVLCVVVRVVWWCVCVVCGEAWRTENPPCVDSKRLRVYCQDVSVCTVRTSPCVQATGPHVQHMRARCRYTRRRPDRTHGGVLHLHTGGFFSPSPPLLLSLFPALSLSFLSFSLLSFSFSFSSLLLSLLFSSLHANKH